MSTIQNLFQQAQLAEAAYADLWDATLNQPITAEAKVKTALIAAGFSKDPNDATKSAQADDFLLHWQVLSQYTAPSNFYGLTGTGFSATLFFSKDTGQYTFAIRGTEPGYPDLLGADFGDLVVDGLPLDQIVEMYNYWQSLTHPGHYQAAKLEVQLAETAALKLLVGPLYTAAVAALQASGAIIDTTPVGTVVRRIVWDDSATLLAGTPLALGSAKISGTPTQLNVTGHSLGGNLAAAFTRLFPGVDANAITINGAGFPTGNLAGLSGNAASNIRNLFGNLNGAGAFDASRIQNVVGDGPKMVSMDSQYGLVQPGKPQLDIYIEDHLGNTVGHGAAQMTDSLALYSLFGSLDPTLNSGDLKAGIDKITGILKASSNTSDLSLENALDALRKTLLNVDTTTTTDDRESLYTNLNALKNSDEYKSLTGSATLRILTGEDASSMVTRAKADFGDFLAIEYLTPFAIEGSWAILGTAHPDLYAQYQADQALTADERTQGKANFSDAYLADRAAFLTWKNKLATEDFDGTTGAYSKAPDACFKDLGSNLTINLGSGGSLTDNPRYIFGADQADGATENLTGGSKADRLYGGGGMDILNGDAGADYLEGNSGDDSLTGGAGSDMLLGGDGNDTYIFNSGDGWDWIDDTDGLGQIRYGSDTLSGGAKLGDNLWQSADKKYTYSLSDRTENGATFKVLAIQGPDGGMWIKHWQDGQLGIRLKDAAPDTAQYTDVAGAATTGENQKIQGGDGNESLAAIFPNDMALGGNGDDILFANDGAGEQKFYGEGGNDILQTGSGDDLLDGGSGNDFLDGGLGNDTLIGGAGNDHIESDADMNSMTAANEATYRRAA